MFKAVQLPLIASLALILSGCNNGYFNKVSSPTTSLKFDSV